VISQLSLSVLATVAPSSQTHGRYVSIVSTAADPVARGYGTALAPFARQVALRTQKDSGFAEKSSMPL